MLVLSPREPLYVPPVTSCSRWVSASVAARARGTPASSKNIQRAALTEGIPFLSQVRSSNELADWAFLLENRGEHPLQIRDYALVAAGRWPEATQDLERLISTLHDGTGWMGEIRDRAARLLELVRETPDEASRLLASWQEGTVTT
jgi:hypothetical protein